MIGWRWVLAGVVAAFIVLVIGGYTLGWTWTGFPGNTFWDWLELLALPVVVALLPLWFETHATMAREWRLVLGILLVGFVVVVIGGYRLHWAWTGFEGNTFRDWLSLLIVPFLLPASLAWFAARDRARHEAEGTTQRKLRQRRDPKELRKAGVTADRRRLQQEVVPSENAA